MTVIFCWLFLIYLEIARNFYLIENRKQRPVYWQSNVGRVVVGFVFWIISPWFIWPSMNYWHWWGMVPMMLLSFWFFFDYGLNVVRQVKPFYYLNPEGSFLDRFQCNYPNSYVWFWWKLMLMITGVMLFHYGLDYIWIGV